MGVTSPADMQGALCPQLSQHGDTHPCRCKVQDRLWSWKERTQRHSLVCEEEDESLAVGKATLLLDGFYPYMEPFNSGVTSAMAQGS